MLDKKYDSSMKTIAKSMDNDDFIAVMSDLNDDLLRTRLD